MLGDECGNQQRIDRLPPAAVISSVGMVTFHARQSSIAGVGVFLLITALLVWSNDVFKVRENIRELTFDHALRRLVAARSQQSPVIVVDIDSDSLARHGPWPWSRLIIADLLKKIAQAKPRVIGIDILLSEPDRLSPAGLMRSLGELADRKDISELASRMPDGDAAIAAALTGVPSVFGFVLDASGKIRRRPACRYLHVDTSRRPTSGRRAARSGRCRRSLRSGAASAPWCLQPTLTARCGAYLCWSRSAAVCGPDFAVEMLRVSYEAASFIVDTAPQQLHIGPLSVPIDMEAALRVLPQPAASWRERTIPGWRVIDDASSRARLAGRIVLVGSGAPEVGDLRETPVSATTPSVQIQADALATLVGNVLPRRPSWVSRAEIFGAAVLGLVAIALAIFCRPAAATVLAGLLCLIWVAGAVAAFEWERTLIDMSGPPLIAGMVFVATTLGTYVQNERLARALRRRFERHLPPDVVKRLLDAPNILRLSGESREVTALFTDIEGFSSLTDRSDATEVLQLLDEYLTIVTDTVVAHGGMVDKLIGDGVFALFNAPLDLADHARHAVAAANAIIAATDSYRLSALAVKLALGRTRIGIETGVAIVGDVGGDSKLDYTALGKVVNTASRLEGINKEFKTSICIGPVAASMLSPHEIRRLGDTEVRGRSGKIEVFTVAERGVEKRSSATPSPQGIPLQN